MGGSQQEPIIPAEVQEEAILHLIQTSGSLKIYSTTSTISNEV